MKYKCIIFDCDGVLVDSETISNQTMVDFANELGANITLDFALRNFVGKSLKEWMTFLEEKIGKPLPHDFETTFRQRTFKAFEEGIQAIKGVPELLERLDIPFCVASSGPRNKIRLNLEKSGIIHHFEGKIFSCYDINKWKPEPDIFLHAAQEMGFHVNECLVIEDSPSGIRAAKAGGFDVWALLNDHNASKMMEEGVRIFKDMNDLDGMIKNEHLTMEIEKDKSLQNFNTFGIDVSASQFIAIQKEEDLFKLLESHEGKELKILGGGSNLLLTQNQDGIVVKNEIKGIKIVSDDEETVLIEVGGGENWHEFVMWAVENNYGGIENLSLIPGTVGAAPIQNIGAYGVELQNVFEGLNAIHLGKAEDWVFTADECKLSYRNSIFKNDLKGKICITRVYLRLTKAPHSIHISYGAIQKELDRKGLERPTIKDISETIISIRQSKLPDPKELGNSGSFFKNPEISKQTFKALKENFPEVPSYDMPSGLIKIPAAWLIDQCGFKGIRYGNTGCFKNQPLVLVNYGGATGQEILNFSKQVQGNVQEKFNIRISPEVNIW